ncbi:hypothetical protein VTH82DRAFT_3223 [Thermothelomyces myriococcoides]
MGFLSNFVLLMAATAAVADPSTPKIASIKFSGNGCLKDPKFSGSFDAPRLTFSNFAAALPGSNQTVNCQVHLQTQGSTPGWQVALKSNVVKGHVVLSPGTTLTHYTTVYFSQDAAKTDTFSNSVENTGSTTINKAVTLTGNAGNEKVWSPCGSPGIMNINFRGALVGSGEAYFEANTEEWDLEWRKC